MVTEEERERIRMNVEKAKVNPLKIPGIETEGDLRRVFGKRRRKPVIHYD